MVRFHPTPTTQGTGVLLTTHEGLCDDHYRIIQPEDVSANVMNIHQTPVPRWLVSDVYLWGLDSLRRPVSLTRIEIDSRDDLAMFCYEIPEYLFINPEIFYVVPEVVL